MDRKLLMIGILMVFFLMVGSLYVSSLFRLSRMGYSRDDIKLIRRKHLVISVSRYKYNSHIKDILDDDDFKNENVKMYLNVKYSKPDIFVKAINMLKKLGYTKRVISYFVNHLDYDELVLAFNSKKRDDVDFYIGAIDFDFDNLERYKEYKKKHRRMAVRDIVTRVNIGLDMRPYSNVRIISNPSSYYTLVNKYLSLASYRPNDLERIDSDYSIGEVSLRRDACRKFNEMALNMKKEALNIKAFSGYRGYHYQVGLYNNYVVEDGEDVADTYSSRPGHSEHQLGLAVDVSNGKVSYQQFGSTLEYQWMIDNAYKYGFILRYPENKSDVTLFKYEAWHFRYVGDNIALDMHQKKDLSYDEYYYRYVNKK